MIVVRFKVRCRPERIEQALALFREIVAASRPLDGVMSFDIGRDITDPDTFIATEVFEDRATLDRQESLPPTKKTIDLLDDLLVAAPEQTVFEVLASEP